MRGVGHWGRLLALILAAAATIAAAPVDDEVLIAGGQYNDPRHAVLGPDGCIWFAQFQSRIGRFDPATRALDHFPTTSAAHGIAVGSDGMIWYTMPLASKLGRMQLDGTGLPDITLPAAAASRAPYAIVRGPDGAMWWAERNAAAFGRIADASSFPIIYNIPGGGTPEYMCIGGDGNIWATDPANNRVYKITNTGGVTAYAIPTVNSGPKGITLGADGNVWFAEAIAAKLGRITPSGTITEFPLPVGATPFHTFVQAVDGAFYGAEQSQNVIGRIANPTGAATYTSFTTTYTPWGICRGPDGMVVATLNSISLGSGVARVDVAVNATASLPPVGIGSDGTRWHALSGGTPEGLARLRAEVARLAPYRAARGFAWDAAAQRFVELPAEPTDGLGLDDGLFVVTKLPDLALDLAGAATPAPYDLTLRPGWNLVAIPALVDAGVVVTSHPLAACTLAQPSGVPVSGAARTAAMSGAWWWDGAAYQAVSTLEAGRSSWIRNLTSQPLVLIRVDTLSGGVAVLSQRAEGVDPGAPPAPPAGGAAADGPGGCGGGAALGLAGAWLAWRRRRKEAA